eukprot:3421539-Rhodomonas_salina.1
MVGSGTCRARDEERGRHAAALSRSSTVAGQQAHGAPSQGGKQMQQPPQTPQQPAASIGQHTPQTLQPAQAQPQQIATNLASTFAAVIAGAARECAPQHTPQAVAVPPPQPPPLQQQTVRTAGTGAIDCQVTASSFLSLSSFYL